MGHDYQAVQWNPQKRRYDALLAAGVVLFLGACIGGGAVLFPEATAETLILRGLGATSFFLLHVVLCIGPLARLDSRWLPWLYNRRHMGVTMALLAVLHGAFALLQFHAFGDVNAFVSLFAANPRWDSLAHFPFQPLGAAALLIIVLMASTSHDFWLANLTAPVWKALHMLVYVAYALIVLHVALGVLQAETSPLLVGLVLFGVLTVGTLHIAAARRDSCADADVGVAPSDRTDGWIDVCSAAEIEDGRAKIILASGERIAIFRSGVEFSAVSAVCQHQNGPLGEGRIVDGLIVCPWHGYQYKPRCGRSPEPFQEVVPTFALQLRGERIWLNPDPLPLGTDTNPLTLGASDA